MMRGTMKIKLQSCLLITWWEWL